MFQIPEEGGRVGLTVGLCYDAQLQVTLLDHCRRQAWDQIDILSLVLDRTRIGLFWKNKLCFGQF